MSDWLRKAAKIFEFAADVLEYQPPINGRPSNRGDFEPPMPPDFAGKPWHASFNVDHLTTVAKERGQELAELDVIKSESRWGPGDKQFFLHHIGYEKLGGPPIVTVRTVMGEELRVALDEYLGWRLAD